jgi:hypothetical protein
MINSVGKKTSIISSQIILVIVFVFLFSNVSAQTAVGWKHKQELYGLLQNPADSIYIQDRGALQELFGSVCTKTDVRYYSSTKASELIQISIKTKIFVPSLHEIKLTDTLYSIHHGKKRADSVTYCNRVDGTLAYGISGTLPKEELGTFIILRGNTKLQIPKSAYSDLYNIHLCENNKAPEAYITEDNKHLYIYMHGGEGKAAYAVKFVFDQKGFVTRILNTHPCLKDFDFIDGFGECE